MAVSVMEADEGSEEGRREEKRRQAAGRGTGKVKVRKSRLSENVLCVSVIPQQVQRVPLMFNFNRHTSCTFPPLCGNADGS